MDYKKMADSLESMPALETKWITQKEFKVIVEKRKFKYIQLIDKDDFFKREVWGNRLFYILVKYNKLTKEYKII